MRFMSTRFVDAIYVVANAHNISCGVAQRGEGHIRMHAKLVLGRPATVKYPTPYLRYYEFRFKFWEAAFPQEQKAPAA